jgi:hypothetical protein
MTTSRGKTLARICDLISLLMKAPRTRREISELWELKAEADITVSRYFDGLHDEGLIHIIEWREPAGGKGMHAAVFAWQTSPFAKPDVERTSSRSDIRDERAARRAARAQALTAP